MGDKKIMPLFTVIFEDGTNFIGGTSYFETKWMEIPYKKIKRIFYKLPTDDYICLSGDKYFHMVEATKDWARIGGDKVVKLKGQPRVEYSYIMVRKNDKVTSYRITLIGKNSAEKNCHIGSNKYRIGDITVREFNINDEKIQKLNPDIWR